MIAPEDRLSHARPQRGGPSPALIAGSLIVLIVLGAIVTLALVGGGKRTADSPTAEPTEVDPFEGLGPDPLHQKK